MKYISVAMVALTMAWSAVAYVGPSRAEMERILEEPVVTGLFYDMVKEAVSYGLSVNIDPFYFSSFEIDEESGARKLEFYYSDVSEMWQCKFSVISVVRSNDLEIEVAEQAICSRY